MASATAHFYTLIAPGDFESFTRHSGWVLAQSFDGELLVPGPVPPEAVGATSSS